MRHFLTLWLLCTTLTATVAQEEIWYGSLSVAGNPLPLVLTVGTDGQSGTLQSPAQSPDHVPLTSLLRTDDSLRFSMSSLKISYAGARREASYAGTFRQGPFTAPLTFSREKPAEATEATARPQEPVTFPYARETVRFASAADSITLAGELTLPEDGPPRALVVLISGSGPQDRNEDLGPGINHRPFLVLSDYLTRRGYGVLRYDDRGAGESTGDFAAATSADFARDAAGAVAFLRERGPGSVPVGLLGHSEGGMIAPLVAAEDSTLDFIILLAGPGVPIDSLLLEQRRAVAAQPPTDEPVAAAAFAYVKGAGDRDSSQFARGLRDTILAQLPRLSAATRETITDPEAYADDFAEQLSMPWVRYFLAYEPEQYLRRVTMPVLALNGALDTQVAPRNLHAIARILTEAGNPDVTAEVLPGLNHLLQPATSGRPDEYGQIEVTMDPGALDRIAGWLDARF